MFKNPKFASTETSSFNTLYRQLSFQKLFALELHKTSKNCKNCWAVFQAAINSAAIFNFQKYWSQNVGQDFIVLDFFVGGRSCGRKRCVREINVSRAWDPVHAGEKALTRETPAKRGRVNRYAIRIWDNWAIQMFV